MPRDQLQAMWYIENCQSGMLGVAVYAYQQCGKLHSVARSCGNRHCPTCQADKGQRWLEKQLDKLLPCPCFFLCFRVPEAARLVMWAFPKECYGALLEAAAEAMMSLAIAAYLNLGLDLRLSPLCASRTRSREPDLIQARALRSPQSLIL